MCPYPNGWQMKVSIAPSLVARPKAIPIIPQPFRELSNSRIFIVLWKQNHFQLVE
jgi:hypothetical protein